MAASPSQSSSTASGKPPSAKVGVAQPAPKGTQGTAKKGTAKPAPKAKSKSPIPSKKPASKPLKEWDQGGSPAPKQQEVPKKDAPPPPRASDWHKEIAGGLRASAPLLVCAAILLFLAADWWGKPTKIMDRAIPLYFLFLMVGTITATGGTVGALVPDEESLPPRSNKEYVVVPRPEWQAIQSRLLEMSGLSSKPSPTEHPEHKWPPAPLETKAPATPEPKPAGPVAPLDVGTLSTSVQELLQDMGLESAPPSPPTPAPVSKPVEPRDSEVEKEVEALRAAFSTGVDRESGESPVEFRRRAMGELDQTKTSPSPNAVIRAVCRSVLEAYRRLSDDEMRDFTAMIQADARLPMRALRLNLHHEETLPEFIARVEGILEAASKSASLPSLPPEQSARLERYLSLFNGLFSQELNKKEASALLTRVALEAARKGLPPLDSEPEAELRGYADLIKDTLRLLAGTAIGEWEASSLAKAIDALVVERSRSPGLQRPSMESPPAPPTPSPPPEAAPPEVPAVTVPGLTPSGPPSPPKEEVPTATLVATPSTPPPLEGTPDYDEAADDAMEHEIEAFYAAMSSGVERKEQEPVADYLQRARSQPPPDETPEAVVRQAYAGASSLAEACRRLGEREVVALFASVGPEAERILGQTGTLREPGEPMTAFVLRVLRTKPQPPVAPKPEPAPSPMAGLGGLTWSLALFRGVLETYLGTQEIETVVAGVEKHVAAHPHVKAAGGEELLTYAGLVKNSLRMLPPGAIKPEDLVLLNRAIDQFVEDMGALGSSKKKSVQKKQKEEAQHVKDELDDLFRSMLQEKKE